MSEEKDTYAGNATSGITQQETVSPLGCNNLQWLPVIGVYPGGIGPVGETNLGSDCKLYMPSSNNLTISAIRGPDEQEYSIDLPVALFGVSSFDLSPGQPIVVTSAQTSVALTGRIVATQKNDGTSYTLDVVICPVGTT
jgi:hypothetical protein